MSLFSLSLSLSRITQLPFALPQIYCERFRNLDYLQRELDLHTSREMKKLAENDRSLKKLQKKFRDDELAILRGEQEDQVDGSLVDAMDNQSGGRPRVSNNSNQKAKGGAGAGGRAGATKKAADEDESGSDESGSDEDGSSDDEQSGGSGSDSDQVSVADSAELIDNDDESGSDGNSEDEEGSRSGHSGSETNSDSDQDF